MVSDRSRVAEILKRREATPEPLPPAEGTEENGGESSQTPTDVDPDFQFNQSSLFNSNAMPT